MSTKTLRKRIALVAVSALGAGLLAIVAGPAANAAVTSARLTVIANGNTSSYSQGLLGSLAGSTGAVLSGNTNTGNISSTGVLAVSLASGSAGATDIAKLSVSGGYISSASAGSSTAPSLAADQKSVTVTGAGNSSPVVVIKGFAVGTPLVLTTSYSADAGSTYTTDTVLTVTPVLSGTVNTFSASKSYFSVEASGQAASDNVDATITASSASTATYPASTVANPNAGYFGYAVYDSNGSALSSPVVVATATGGCLVKAAGTAAGSMSTDYSTSASSWFRIDRPTANAPASCTVSIAVNGTTAATRTFTFLGQVASIKITASGIVKASSSATNASIFYYDAKDSAGNSLDGITVSADSSYYNGGLTSVLAAGVSAPFGSATVDNSLSTITCVTKGSYKMKLKATDAGGSTVYSDEFTITCAGSPVNYKAALDKSSYVPGDIATVTITATDSAGKATYDAATAGSGASIAGSNLTAVTAPTAADTFTSGVLKYKFVVGSTEGSYQLVVDLPAYDSTTYNQAAVTLPYTIKASSASVTNAEVLAAIVKLIASINKQIAALQKALKK